MMPDLARIQAKLARIKAQQQQGLVAQPEERRPPKPEVPGSNPGEPATSVQGGTAGAVRTTASGNQGGAAPSPPLLLKDSIRALRGLPVAVIDFETTDADPSEARVVEVAVVHIDSLGDSEPYVAYRSLVNPGVGIPKGAQDVHGISDEDVADAPTWPEVVPHIAAACSGRAMLAYNAAYEHRVILGEQGRHDHPLAWGLPWGHWLDLLIWVRHVDKYEKGKSLGDAARRRGVLVEAHGAAGDTMTTAMLTALALKDLARGKARISKEALKTVSAFLAWQRIAALGQERDLTAYFAERGRATPPDNPWHDLEGEAPPPWKAPPPATKCESCDAPVVWGVTKAGRRIILDPPELDILVTARHPKGATRRVIIDAAGNMVTGWFFASDPQQAAEGERWVRGREAHFASCPHADKHRRL